MRESMRKSLILTLLAVVILLGLGATAQAVKAQQIFDRLTVVAIDRYSISSGDANDQLVKTFLGLLVNLKGGERLRSCFRTIQAKSTDLSTRTPTDSLNCNPR